MSGLLNSILWLPILGTITVLLVPKNKHNSIRWVSLITTAITFLLTLVLYCGYDPAIANTANTYMVKYEWIKSFNIFYTLGVDGISLPMVVLNGLLFLLCVLSSWHIEKKVKAYFALMLVLQSSIFGVFFALDFFLFYVYWEVMLIPMFFLIALWGGEDREKAAVKFILYTFFGSILMLVGIIALYYVSGKGVDSLNIIALQGGKFSQETISLWGKTFSFEKIFFWIMFLGFAIKVPMIPFHTWLPHAHVQAPTAVSVILAGVLLKMGAYGFIRISFPIFPHAAAEYSNVIALLGLISILHGAFCALAQTDVKKLVAYSSVSHMGFVMLGLASMSVQGVNGAVMQMFNHGTSTAMMFLLIGILYERSHHRYIVKPDGSRGFSGLALQMPIFTVIFLIGMFASIGLPGMSGFVSEFLIFLGSFKVFTLYTVLAAIGLFFGAAYLLWMYKRMFFGPISSEVKEYSDISKLEITYMVPLCILVIVLGFYPSPLTSVMKSSVGYFVKQMMSIQ